MEDYSSILTVTAAVVPIAHFFYTLGRDFRAARLIVKGQPTGGEVFVELSTGEVFFATF